MEYRFDDTEVVSPKENEATSATFLVKVFGYMFIGLLITAVISLGWYFVTNLICYDEAGKLTETGARIVLGTSIGSIIGMFVISLVISFSSMRSNKAPWVGFILYAVFVGFAFSIFLITGISIVTFAEAFGITALAFGSMFLIGYFMKGKINWFVYIALGLGVGILLTSLFWWVFYLISPATFSILNWVISIGIIVLEMIFVAIDAYNIKNIAARGEGNQNLALFCAFNIYCDFITMFVRILAILARSKRD